MSERVHRDGDGGADATALERLGAARDRVAEIEREIDDRGDETVATVATAYRNAAELLDSYVDRATGTGRENFKAYIELEGRFASLVDGLADDLPRRDAFENSLDAIDKRRLSEADFERARDALAPAERYADLVDERQDACEALTEARKAASVRVRELGDEIARRERLLELASADLDAPVDRLREPIETYNAAIREAFAEYRGSASAREVFSLLDRSRWYPFVEFEQPPEDLREYVETAPAGEYAIPELLEYADYSRSKLSHYVDDGDRLKRQVATQQTFLEGIDADPLSIEWPPGPAEVLRRRARELQPFVGRVVRVADGDEAGAAMATLREVRRWSRDPDYDRLQTAAQAIEQLSPDECDRLADGRVEAELESLRAERERLEKALEEDDPI
ncbi:DUF7118 family protein [Halosolutus gelatinilyticus]|uniref:DUF7118 family protein n=1 Tax=Halosolutus gelatinilyticus TaxID=2931975 RepID=UPI001FF23778|nr:hypothetical protein [Halosolutus gelatinilyticus]